MGPTTATTATSPTTPTSIFEQSQQELMIVMECMDGKPIKTSTPKKTQPIPDIPEIILPFPPNVSALEMFEKILEKNNHKSSVTKNSTNFADKKAPNKFLIYRKVFVDELHRLNLNLPMTGISGVIAKRWNSEPKHVQQAYQKIASEIDDLRKERFGTDSRKKSKKSQGRTFSAPTSNNHNNVNNAYIPMPNSNEGYGNIENIGNLHHNYEHLDSGYYNSYNFTNNINSINNITTQVTQHIPQIQQQHMYSPDLPVYLHPHLTQQQYLKPDPSYILSNSYHPTSVV